MTSHVVTLTLILICCTACNQAQISVDEGLSQQYEFKMISSGDNVPNFYPMEDNLCQVVVLLHQGKTQNEIQRSFDWTDRTMNAKLELLKNASFIKSRNDGNLTPNVFVCSLDDGLNINKQLDPIVKQTADSIEKKSKHFAQDVAKLDAFRAIRFEDVSLLVLSDVLLDNWQIENIEKEVLRSPRTLRHGKHYYASYQEKSKGTATEAFGIYGNQIDDAGSFSVCRYGNVRYSKEILSLSKELKSEYASSKSTKQPNCPIIDIKDYGELQKTANSFKPTLITILNQRKDLFQKTYRESVYSSEISYEEYFIWVYHFFYTAVTEELISRKVISMPKEKVAIYILKNE